MKNILLCDDDASIRQIVGMVIEAEYDFPVVYAANAQEAIELLKTNIDIGLILCDYNMPGETGAAVFNYNKDARNVPFFMMSGDGGRNFKGVENLYTNPHNGVLQKPWEERDLYKIVEGILLNSVEDEDISDSGDVKKRIRSMAIKKYLHSEMPIYKKINEFEYEPFTFTPDLGLSFYKENPYVYVDQKVFDEILRSINGKLVDYGQALDSFTKIFEMSATVMDKVLINTDMLDMTINELEEFAEAVEKQVSLLRQEEELAPLIDKILRSNDYYVGHSVLAMQISFKLAKKLGFGQDVVISKLLQASILHDALFDDETLSRFNSMEDVEKSSLSDKQKHQVLSHPIEFANYYKKFDWISEEVISAIANHHNRLDGKGFAKPLDVNEISTFATIFNISLQVADELFTFGQTPEAIERINENLKQHYLIGQYEFPAQILMGILS